MITFRNWLHFLYFFQPDAKKIVFVLKFTPLKTNENKLQHFSRSLKSSEFATKSDIPLKKHGF